MLQKMVKLAILKKKWRRLNTHNETFMVDLFPMSVVRVGRYTYGGLKVLSFGKDYQLRIGDFCSIGPNVLFILQADHLIDRVSSFPFKVKMLGVEEYEAVSKGNILVDDDVWIGANVTILSGIHIHRGAVIAAGALVSSDVPPYAIIGGVPAKVIRYRFTKDVIDKLLTIDYRRFDRAFIEAHLEELYKPLNTVDDFNFLF